MKVFQVGTSIVYDSFFRNLALALVLQCYCGDSFKTLVTKKTTIWRLKKSHSNDKL